MSSSAFVTPAVGAPLSVASSSFVAVRPAVPVRAAQGVQSRRAHVVMMAEGYKIQQSEYRDPDTEDDSGDGFIGESEMDDMLGVSMPEDLASFEVREIQNSQTRDELVDKLRNIAQRRRGILEDRRKGMGMDNAKNYLDRL